MKEQELKKDHLMPGQMVSAYHQYYRLQSSGWTAHLRVTGYITTGYEPKSSGSSGVLL